MCINNLMITLYLVKLRQVQLGQNKRIHPIWLECAPWALRHCQKKRFLMIGKPFPHVGSTADLLSVGGGGQNHKTHGQGSAMILKGTSRTYQAKNSLIANSYVKESHGNFTGRWGTQGGRWGHREGKSYTPGCLMAPRLPWQPQLAEKKPGNRLLLEEEDGKGAE